MTRTNETIGSVLGRGERLRNLRPAVIAVIAAVAMGMIGFALPGAASASARELSFANEPVDVASLSGTVTLDGGRVSGEYVAVQLRGVDGRVYSTESADTDGNYRISTPKAGDYRIIFSSSQDFGSVPGPHETQYLGGTPDPSKARVLTVTLGVDHTGLDITLPLFNGEPTTISRIEGDDRYSTAVSVSQNHWPDGAADAVWIVTGENYPDALSAGPAAVFGNDPVLLTESGRLPDDVTAEIVRLGASKVVVVGGPKSVSDGVFAELQRIIPDTTRISGADRYEVSRNVASTVFGEFVNSITPIVATGTNYPDALTAGSLGGASRDPVILVDGSRDSVDRPTIELLTSLEPNSLRIVGGTSSVSDAIRSQLEGVAVTTRVSGENRYDTAVELVGAYQLGIPRYAYLVTGSNFPDALSAAASTGSFVQPLYLSETDCVPERVMSSMLDLGLEWVVVIGGEKSLGVAVEGLVPCA
jgi:putative cell wall-binding protein